MDGVYIVRIIYIFVEGAGGGGGGGGGIVRLQLIINFAPCKYYLMGCLTTGYGRGEVFPNPSLCCS